jgi:hypothetical protein
MPKQSRGFWVCSLCSLAFDRLDEASYHETEDCPLRYSTGDPSLSWQQQQIQPDPYGMPPLSSVTNTTTSGHHRDLSAASFSYDLKSEPRFFPLLAPNQQSNLRESDAIICKSVELFDSSELAESGRVLAQLGLRCSLCTSPSSEFFPHNIQHVGDCVRQIAEQHLTTCRALPQPSRDVLKRAGKQRQQFKKEGGFSWNEEEEHHRSLTDFCTSRCRQIGVVDREPRNSGIMLDTISLSLPQNSLLSSGRGAPVSSPVARRTETQPNDSFQTTHMYSDRHQLGPYHSPPYDSRQRFENQVGIESRSHTLETFETSTDQSPIHPDSRSIPSTVYNPYVTGYIIPPDFPFIQERSGEWVCKFCCHLHPQLRDPKFYWMSPDRSPPPADIIDCHLSLCRVFQENQYHSYEFQGLPANHPQGSHPDAPGSSFNPTRWDGTFEGDQQMLGSGGDPMHHTQQYASLPRENTLYETSAYNQHPPPTTHRYSTESQQAATYGSSGLMTSRQSLPESSVEYDRAIEFLSANDKSLVGSDGEVLPETVMLVLGEDKLLLTDYFFYVMKQLRPVRFSEADRRTRGGKRENISVGYGGLQCVHCSELPNARKFFWSNVDRLANSFAEIPSHVLKCRRCPQPTKDALLLLKHRHPEQMARLPRGSQKVFFRRMWRRLHDEDPPGLEDRASPITATSSTKSIPYTSALKTSRPNPVETGLSMVENSPAGTSGSEESIFMLQRSTEEAAKALADAAMQSDQPSPSSRVLLAVPDDPKWLSDTDCFIRRQLEVFCSTSEDVENARNDRKYPVQEGQVGIRCVHCALSKSGARGQAVAYPFNISGIYEAAREFQRLHLETCENLPPAAKSKLVTLKGSSSLSSVLRKYYIIAANALGLTDGRDGIHAGGKSIPIGSQAAFAFSDDNSPRPYEDIRVKSEDYTPLDAVSESRKRVLGDEGSAGNPDVKRPAK